MLRSRSPGWLRNEKWLSIHVLFWFYDAVKKDLNQFWSGRWLSSAEKPAIHFVTFAFINSINSINFIKLFLGIFERKYTKYTSVSRFSVFPKRKFCENVLPLRFFCRMPKNSTLALNFRLIGLFVFCSPSDE